MAKDNSIPKKFFWLRKEGAVILSENKVTNEKKLLFESCRGAKFADNYMFVYRTLQDENNGSKPTVKVYNGSGFDGLIMITDTFNVYVTVKGSDYNEFLDVVSTPIGDIVKHTAIYSNGSWTLQGMDASGAKKDLMNVDSFVAYNASKLKNSHDLTFEVFEERDVTEDQKSLSKVLLINLENSNSIISFDIEVKNIEKLIYTADGSIYADGSIGTK